MKLMRIFLILLLTISAVTAQNKNTTKEKTAASVVLKTQGDSISYAIGQNIYGNLKDPGIQLNLNVLIESLKDASKTKSVLTQDEIMKVLTALNSRMQERQMAQQKQEEEKRKVELGPVIEKNKKESELFLEANKKKEGVITTASGLQYKVLVAGPGTGPTPKDESTLKVNYRGTTLDGNEFDSSYKRNQPYEFPLNQMILGWREAIQLMHVGDKYELYIPYQLAYGEEGRGEVIPPASVLIFEVELLEIVK